MTEGMTISETVNAWEDLGPIQRSPSFAPPPPPSAKTVEIIGKLGLRYPPANSVDREAHAARIALLAEDCADLDPSWLDEAARRWARDEPFMPRACELRERALEVGRIRKPARLLSPPPQPERKRPVAPPLTDDEVSRLPEVFVTIGLTLGEITPDQVARLRPSTTSQER